MSVAIRTRQVRKNYGQTQAVNNLDLEVGHGTVFGLIGPNGAGKTTTLRMLLDIIRPTSGDIEVLGISPQQGGAALRRRIGYVPGELRLDRRMTGRAMLHYLAKLSGPVTGDAIESLSHRLGLDLSRPVHSLSKGNKQKLGLVQAFMHTPELLILDEPTSGLDPLVQRVFLEMVHEARDAGQTVLLSSHVLSEIQQSADDVAVLAHGEIVARGDVASLRLGSIRHIHSVLQAPSVDAVRQRLTRIPALEGLEVAASGEGLVAVSATAHGNVDETMRALTDFTIRDLTVEEPDLEESVLALYEQTQSAS